MVLASNAKLITFDVTNTLLKFRTSVFEQYAEAGIRFGIHADPDVLKVNFKEEWKKMTTQHPIYGRYSGLGWRDWWTSMVKGAFKNYVKERDDNIKLSQIAEYLIKSFETQHAWTVKNDGRELLEYLKTQPDLKLGVISNFDPRLHTILKAMNLSRYFDFVVTSYEVGFEKPDHQIFEEALKMGNNVPKNFAIHVGDNVDLDYLGAKHAGWNSFLINPDLKETGLQVNSKEVFPDLRSLMEFFETGLRKK